MTRYIVSGLVGLGLLLVSIGFAAWQTSQAFQAGRRLDLTAAAGHAQLALPVTTILSGVTLGLQPDIGLWHQSLLATIESEKLANIGTQYLPLTLSKDENAQTVAHEFRTQLLALNKRLEKMTAKLDQSWVAKRLVRANDRAKMGLLQTSLVTMEGWLSGQHIYLVIFQNSQELRATGGFMGTYALVKIQNGVVQQLTFQDIYEPDGQFAGYLEPPPGVKEYLSGGNGWRLPDANWEADFATSAQHILSFFALVNQTDIEGVIVINLPVAEKILEITGPIVMTDFGETVTSQNFATLARADRENFFPGSQQKENFLSTFFYRLLFMVQGLNRSQQQQLLRLLVAEAKLKNLLFYSQLPGLQQWFRDTQVAGVIDPPAETDFYFYAVESNVGINKANKGIDRSVKLILGETASTIEMRFVNRNYPPTEPTPGEEADHLGYINYQRLIFLPDVSITSILVDDKPVKKWDEEIITTSTGKKVKQIGFLVTVPEQQQIDVVVKTAHPELPVQPAVYLQKQPGLPAVSYLVEYSGTQKDLFLDFNRIIQF